MTNGIKMKFTHAATGIVLAAGLLVGNSAMAQSSAPVASETAVVAKADGAPPKAEKVTPKTEFKNKTSTKTEAELKAEAALAKKAAAEREAAIDKVVVKRSDDRWYKTKDKKYYDLDEDGNKEEIPEKAVRFKADMDSAKADGMVLVIFVNGKRSNTDPEAGPVVWPDEPGYDADDGTLFTEATRAAQELRHDGVPFAKLVLATSETGADHLQFYIDGHLMTSSDTLAAGHGGGTKWMVRQGKEDWKLFQRAKANVLAKSEAAQSQPSLQ